MPELPDLTVYLAAGSLLLTEAGSRKRASLLVIQGETELPRHDPRGLEVLAASADDFRAAVTRETHTLKRALTDPRILYASNEANYCPRCQTGGRVLADRALSRLPKSDWPQRIEDLEGRS